jgi:predicted deacylase
MSATASRAGPRRTEKVNLLTDSVGMQPFLKIHKYGPEDESVPLAYIQGSLHADELPGIMVNHHLLKMLDVASRAGWMAKRVHIVPYANPFGLYQTILGNKQGRFNIATGTNFNRSFDDVTEKLLAKGILKKKS